MKMLKRILLGIIILVALLIGAAIALPIIFKDDLIALTKEELNKNLRATVDFGDVDLSLFRHFPHLSLSIRDFSIVGVGPFENIPLASGDDASFTLDIMSVIRQKGPISINSVRFERPRINVLVLEDGTANYDITIPADERLEETASQTDYSGLKIELDEYSIQDANIVYDDRSLQTFVDIRHLDHQGSGAFTIDIFDLDTQTDIDSITLQYGGISYLTNAKATLDAVFNIDQPNAKYTLSDNALKINELNLNAEGFVQLADNDDINMDLAFSSPQNDFRAFFSLIPYAYIQGYENVKVDGRFAFNGTVTGTYNGEKEQYPAFHINLGIDGGQVKYPDLPLGISNINAKAAVNSPGSNFDELTVDVSRLSLRIGDNPFDARFSLRTPVSDPAVDAIANGIINLEDLSKAFPMEGVQQMAGIIEADISINTRMSVVESGQYERVNMSGDAGIRGLKYQSEGLPPVLIRSAHAGFTPRNVQLDQFDAQLGRSDIQASGTIDNILAYFSPKKTMKGDLKVRSNRFDANEWIPEEEGTAIPAGAGEEAEAASPVEVFNRFDFDLDAEAKEILYGEYRLENVKARGNIRPNRLEASDLSMQIGNSDMAMSGVITNLFDYTFADGILGGDIQLKSRLLDLNEFMGQEEAPAATSAAETPMEPIQIPANIRMKITAEADKVLYTNLDLRNLSGDLLVQDQAVILDNTRASALGGTMRFSGSYDSKDPESPGFTFKYDLEKLDFQQSFNTFNTFQQLAPVGKFISGNFTSSMIMEGQLGKDLMPKLNTLSAEGFLETINGFIANFKPLQSIGEALNINELREKIQLSNSKNWFEVKNGLVEVKPFDVKVKDIAMNISGTHGLNQEMNYLFKTKIPRKLLEKGAIGSAANTGFNLLQTEAAKYGLDLKKSEFVNVQINLTGSITDPRVKLQLLGGDGEQTLAEAAGEKVQETLDAEKARLQAEAEKKLEEGKQAAQEKAGAVIDTARTVVTEKVKEVTEDIKEKAKETLKEQAGDKLGSVIDSTTTKILDKQGQQAVDSIKQKLEKFNPFKKKKKDG